MVPNGRHKIPHLGRRGPRHAHVGSQRLAMPDAIFSSGALAAFLRELLVGSPPFAAEVKDDLEAVVAFHYARLPQLAELPSVAAQAVAPHDA